MITTTYHVICAIIQIALCVWMLVWISTHENGENSFATVQIDSHRLTNDNDLDFGAKTISALLAAFTLITAVAHVIVCCKLRSIKVQSYNPYRWAEYSVTATIMILVIAVSCGVNQLDTILLLLTSCVGCMFCGYVSEKLKMCKKDDKIFGPLQITLLGWWLLLPCFGIIIKNFLEVSENAPDFVTAVVVVMSLLYMSFGIIHLIDMFRFITPQKREVCYLLASMSTKTILVFLLFFGLKSRVEPQLVMKLK